MYVSMNNTPYEFIGKTIISLQILFVKFYPENKSILCNFSLEFDLFPEIIPDHKKALAEARTFQNEFYFFKEAALSDFLFFAFIVRTAPMKSTSADAHMITPPRTPLMPPRSKQAPATR